MSPNATSYSSSFTRLAAGNNASEDNDLLGRSYYHHYGTGTSAPRSGKSKSLCIPLSVLSSHGGGRERPAIFANWLNDRWAWHCVQGELSDADTVSSHSGGLIADGKRYSCWIAKWNKSMTTVYRFHS